MLNYLWDALRQVVFILDQVAYGLIPAVYELIFYLANINLANSDIFVALINRIYLLLGIFMLFKVSFSMIQYIVDPNSFSDSSKGFGKLVTNALVSVVLLATVPFIFSMAYDLQGRIILSNVIPRVILGDTNYEDYSNIMDTDNSDVSEETLENAKKSHDAIETMGKDVQFTLFSAFYSLSTMSADEAKEAGVDENDLSVLCDPSTTGNANSNVIGSRDMAISDKCMNEFYRTSQGIMTSNGVSLASFFKYKKNESDEQAVDKRDFNDFKVLLSWHQGVISGSYRISYFPIISAVVGFYVLFLLVTFAVDVAVRIFKLMFLQAIAPIAIISYIDPKESASNGKLHNWAVECGKTYASLFLRLAIVFLAMQLVNLLTVTVFAPVSNIFTGENYSINEYYYNGLAPTSTMNMFVYVFLIIGIFMFAKQIPQMIEKVFGIQLSGEMNLNPFKAGSGLAALTGGALGGGIGSIAGAIAGGATAKTHGKNVLGGIASGFASGGARGAFGGFKGKDVKNALSNGVKVGGRVSRAAGVRYATGGVRGMPAMVGERLLNTMGGPTTYEMREANAKRYDDAKKAADDFIDMATEKAQKGRYAKGWQKFQGDRLKAAEDLKAGILDAKGYSDQIKKIKDQEDKFVDGVIKTELASGNQEFIMHQQLLEKAMKDSGITGNSGDRQGIKDISDVAKESALNIRADDAHNDAADRHNAIKGQMQDTHLRN